ncbi:uncharacterized protein LOC117102201 [Anneissia japonica]|uniref:uncharacterized protein LOC117102201 n=1 Tax=Anneissia japonica TaxID=1529436 RepID=UPI0014256182|nr:uncharacterized protein LOC117102201 [Anneissia japonica]
MNSIFLTNAVGLLFSLYLCICILLLPVYCAPVISTIPSALSTEMTTSTSIPSSLVVTSLLSPPLPMELGERRFRYVDNILFTSLLTNCAAEPCKIKMSHYSRYLVFNSDGSVTSTRNYSNASWVYMSTYNTAVEYRDSLYNYYLAVNATNGHIYGRSQGTQSNTLWSERSQGTIYSPYTTYYLSIQRNGGDVIGVNSTELALNPRNSNFMKYRPN